MYRIAICSSDEPCLDKLNKLITLYQTCRKQILIVKNYRTSAQLLNSLNFNFDIFLLDNNISYKETNKLTQLILTENPKAYIITLISPNDNFFSIYQNNILGYLAKPLTSASFFVEFDRALKYIPKYQDYLLVKNNFNIYRIYINDIFYIETSNRKVVVHTIDNSLSFYEKMQVLEYKLNKYFFFRCHNCYIINLEFLEKIISLDAYLVTGIRIPISKNRRKSLIEKISTYENLN